MERPDVSPDINDSRASNKVRVSNVAKATKVAVTKSAFVGRVSTLANEARFSKNPKQVKIAQEWEGKELFEINNEPKEETDPTYILFEQLSKEINILSMACTNQHTYVVTTQGNVYSWGSQVDLGRKATSKKEARMPTIIPDLKEIVQIATGNSHVLALNIQGQVFVWGSNQNGQLGLGKNVSSTDRPMPLNAFEDEEGIAQIYAGPSCSFAVARSGALYAWGHNHYGHLGLVDSEVATPQKLTSTPWSSEKDPILVTSKTHVGYVYTTLGASKQRAVRSTISTGDLKNQESKIKEMEEIIKKLTTANAELSEKLFGDKPHSKIERNFEEDAIIKQLTEDAKNTKDELNFVEQRIKHLDNEIEGADNDLKSIRDQLGEIEARENKLTDELQNYENEILRKGKDKEIMRKMKTVEDLTRANEQIKNMIQQKQNDREERRIELNNERDNFISKALKLKERQKMILKLTAERKATIAQGAYSENKSEIVGRVNELYSIFKRSKETTLDELSATVESEKGLLDLLVESNEQLNQCKKDVDKLKVTPSDALFEIISKTIEMFQDNLNTRLKSIKLNQYSSIVTLELTDKLNEMNAAEVGKKKVLETKKVRDAKIAALKQKYSLDAKGSSLANETSSKVNNSLINNSVQKAQNQYLQRKTMAPSNENSPSERASNIGGGRD